MTVSNTPDKFNFKILRFKIVTFDGIYDAPP